MYERHDPLPDDFTDADMELRLEDFYEDLVNAYGVERADELTEGLSTAALWELYQQIGYQARDDLPWRRRELHLNATARAYGFAQIRKEFWRAERPPFRPRIGRGFQRRGARRGFRSRRVRAAGRRAREDDPEPGPAGAARAGRAARPERHP